MQILLLIFRDFVFAVVMYFVIKDAVKAAILEIKEDSKED